MNVICPSEEIRVDGRLTLKWILKKYGRLGLNLMMVYLNQFTLKRSRTGMWPLTGIIQYIQGYS